MPTAATITMIADDNDNDDFPSTLILTAPPAHHQPTPTSMAPTNSHYHHHCYLDANDLDNHPANDDGGNDVSVSVR